MVKNKQVQICDDVLCMLVGGIHSTANDGDYCDDTRELAFDTKVHDYNNNNSIVNIVCDMSRVEYTFVLLVLLVARLKISSLRSYTSSSLYFVYSLIVGLYSSTVLSNITSPLSFPQKQVQVQVQVQVRNNNHNNINCNDDNSIHNTSYCIYRVDTDGENGCGMDNEVPVLVQVLDCEMLRMEYNIRAYNVICGIMHLGYVPSVLLVTSLETSMINDLFPVSNYNNDSLSLFRILKKKQPQIPITIINLAFYITLVFPRSALHLVKLSN